MVLSPESKDDSSTVRSPVYTSIYDEPCTVCAVRRRSLAIVSCLTPNSSTVGTVLHIRGTETRGPNSNVTLLVRMYCLAAVVPSQTLFFAIQDSEYLFIDRFLYGRSFHLTFARPLISDSRPCLLR